MSAVSPTGSELQEMASDRWIEWVHFEEKPFGENVEPTDEEDTRLIKYRARDLERRDQDDLFWPRIKHCSMFQQ